MLLVQTTTYRQYAILGSFEPRGQRVFDDVPRLACGVFRRYQHRRLRDVPARSYNPTTGMGRMSASQSQMDANLGSYCLGMSKLLHKYDVSSLTQKNSH